MEMRIRDIFLAILFTAGVYNSAQAVDNLPPVPALPALPGEGLAAVKSTAANFPEIKLPDPSALPSLPSALPAATTSKENVVLSAPTISAKLPETKVEPLPVPTLPDASSVKLQPPALPLSAPLAEVPPLPPLPTLNNVAPPSIPEPKVEAKTEKGGTIAKQVVVAEQAKIEKPKSKRKKRYAISSSPKLASSEGNYYRSERLPDIIYSKSYSMINRHLPVAFYEQDYDALVFVTAAHNDSNGLRALLNTGRNVKSVNAAGDTALIVAVKHNAIDTARLLIARHANPDAVGGEGLTALDIALKSGNVSMIHVLQGFGEGYIEANAAQ